MGHATDFTAADTDVTVRHVGARPDVTKQLGHEGLAETHDLGIGFALGIEIGSSLGAAHRQCGQRILEYLLESKELENALVHAGMKSQPSLVRPKRAVEFDAESAVDMEHALVVLPGNAEYDLAFGLHESLQDARIGKLGMPVEERIQR